MTDKSRGKKPLGAAAGRRAPGRYAVDECDTFPVPLQPPHAPLPRLRGTPNKTRPAKRPQNLPSTVAIRNLLVAARRGRLLRSLRAAASGDPTCRGKPRPQTHPLITTLFAQSGGDRRVSVCVCVAAASEAERGGRQRSPEAPRCLPTCTHKSSGAAFLRRLLHAQVELREHLTSPSTITVGYKVLR